VGIKRKFKVKVNNTNEELFDGLFKQDLGNASSPVPPGAWEGISGSLSSGSAIAGAAVKTAIWMKAAISVVVIVGISVAVYQYNVSTELKTDVPKQESIAAAESNTEQANEVEVNSDLGVKNQGGLKKSESVEKIDPIRADEHLDHVKDHYDIFDINLPPPIEGRTYDIGSEEKPNGITESSNSDLTNAPIEEPQPVFLTDPSIKDSSYIEVPDAFTNDGDGINDTYLIKLIGEERVEIIIYTADNQIIFRTTNKYTAWDSRMPNGDLAPEGFYFLKFIYKYKNKVQSTPIIRRITLIR
jgi:hypothetical protein